MASDELAMPSKQGRGRDDECAPALPRKQSRKCREHGAIGGGEARSCHLAVHHGELVAKDRDLDVLFVGARTDAEEQELSNDPGR